LRSCGLSRSSGSSRFGERIDGDGKLRTCSGFVVNFPDVKHGDLFSIDAGERKSPVHKEVAVYRIIGNAHAEAPFY
jgi:predicted RNA-binding protein with TRAM domain